MILAHVPAIADPFTGYAVPKPGSVRLVPVSHRLPWPFRGMHSSRLFAARLASGIVWNEVGAVFTRHLKIARALLERFPHLPLVYEAHEVFTDTAPEPRRSQIEALEREVVRRAAALVANSHATAARLTERHAVTTAIHVIPNGVEYPAQLPEKQWHEAAQRVIYAGSFFGWKGVDDLVAAAHDLPGFRIRMLGGDAAAVERLRGQATGKGAALEFTGRVPHGAVAEALAEACIAVLPNRADTDSTFTSPIKLFEYMAAGCAVVASDIPALREVLADGDAQWFEPGDSKALAQAIRALAAEAERARAMGARLREQAKRYTWAARGERLAGVVRPLFERA